MVTGYKKGTKVMLRTPNPIDTIGEHAERVAEKVNEMLKGADDEV